MRQVLGLVVVALTVGCGPDGPGPTFVDELRVAAVVQEPAQAVPGQAVSLTVHVLDPTGAGAQVWVWGCDLDGNCPVEERTLNGGRVDVGAVAVAPVPLWTLACPQALCGAGPSEAERADANAYLQTLPLEGVSAAVGLFDVALPPAQPAYGNPMLDVVPDAQALAKVEAVEAEGSVTLLFRAAGGAVAYPLTTIGRFTEESVDVGLDGRFSLEWEAPEEGAESEGELLVVVEGELGGRAVWRAGVRR